MKRWHEEADIAADRLERHIKVGWSKGGKNRSQLGRYRKTASIRWKGRHDHRKKSTTERLEIRRLLKAKERLTHEEMKEIEREET